MQISTTKKRQRPTRMCLSFFPDKARRFVAHIVLRWFFFAKDKFSTNALSENRELRNVITVMMEFRPRVPASRGEMTKNSFNRHTHTGIKYEHTCTTWYRQHTDIHLRFILSRLALIRRGFGTNVRTWFTAASTDSTKFVILFLHMEGRAPIHHCSTSRDTASPGNALNGWISLSSKM